MMDLIMVVAGFAWWDILVCVKIGTRREMMGQL